MTGELQTPTAHLTQTTRLLWVAWAALIGLMLLTGGGPQEDGVLRGRRIELVDDQGRVRAELAIDADGSAGLFVRDHAGRLRAAVTHDDKQSGLFLWDEHNTVRLGAAHFAHGGGGFALHGPESKGAAVLYYKQSGRLTFYNAAGKVVEQLPKSSD